MIRIGPKVIRNSRISYWFVYRNMEFVHLLSLDYKVALEFPLTFKITLL
jgi:hypothetical protein